MEIFKDKSTSGYLFGGTPYIKSKDVNGNIIYIDPMTGKTVRTEERNGTTYQASAKIKKDQRIREDVRKKHNLRINSGQSIMVGGREVRIGSPKLHYISLSTDNRPLYMKDASKQSYELEYKQLQLDEAEKKTLGALGAFSSYLFPSTYLGALTDLLEGKKSFLGSLVEGNEGLGNPVANLAADIITPYGISKGLNLLANAGKTFGKVGNKALNFLNSPYTGKWTQFGSRKSAEPFTLDDSGELIPLSQRANFDSNDIRYFKDEYGREVTPTPWKGSDLSLLDLIPENLINIIKHYFSPEKTQQIKKAIGWGDKEYSEFLDELLRILQNLATGEVKGPEDGFTIFALHKGYGIGKGPNMVGKHIMTFNRERIPDKKFAVESIIHELGGHGKTMGIDPSKPSVLSEAFPRMTELMKKNLELADEILLFNKRGKFWNLFPKASDLELYLDKKHLSPEKIELFFDKRRYFLYMVKDIQEKVARGYTGLLMDKLGYDKTMNIKLLEKYFTPESVEKFKNAVLNYGTPIIGGTSAYSLYNMLQNNNNQINLKRKGGKLHKYQWGNKILNYINNGFDKPRKIYNKINSSPVNINNLVKYKDEYDNIFMDLKLLKAVDNYMIKKNVGLPQRQAILYTIWLEGSKIGPHGNGASGLVGWRGLRAKGLPNTIEGQAEKLYNEAFGSFNSNNWNHGGEGSGYKSGKEALQAFLNAKTYNDAVRALNYGYVRPDPNSLKKRITSTVFQMKKGGKLLKLQYGSPIYYDLDKGYVTNNIPLTLDKNGNLYANGQKGTIMLPEVTINGKGNITLKTLLKRWLPLDYTKKDIYDLFDFLGHISINNNINNSKPLSDDEINWYNNYMQDKVRKFELFNKSPKDPISYAVKLNPINQRPTSGASENYILDIITRAHNQALLDLNNYYNSEEYKQRLDKMDPSLRKVIKPMNNDIPFKIMSNDNFEENVIAEANGGTKLYVSYNLGNVDSSPYSTSTHELSHIHDYYYPILNNYNNKYIKLNPYLSDKDKSYYGKPTEIKARAMEVFMDYLNNKNKYNSIEDFINKNLEHRTLNQLKYIFKDEKSLFDYLNNFVYNDNKSSVDKNLFAKLGGKMNTIDFLKNGGIHIKKENKGKFTDYCGGKVTSECISKGKHSSNPAIRKRATFAANARKWKHKYGGFVNGVSILDSNPDAYKYVKKKIKKAADGSLLTIGLKIGNAINSPLGKLGIDVGLKLIGGILDTTNKIKYNEYLLNWKKNYINSQSLSDAERQKFYAQSVYNQQMNNSNVSDIVASHDAWKLEQQELQKRKKAAEMLANLYITQMSLIDNNNLTGGFNFAGMATDILSGVLGNSSKTQAVTNPSSTYSLFKMPPIDFKVDMKNMKL